MIWALLGQETALTLCLLIYNNHVTNAELTKITYAVMCLGVDITFSVQIQKMIFQKAHNRVYGVGALTVRAVSTIRMGKRRYT